MRPKESTAVEGDIMISYRFARVHGRLVRSAADDIVECEICRAERDLWHV